MLRIRLIIFLCVSLLGGNCFAKGATLPAIDVSKRAERSNAALKKSYEVGKADIERLRKLVSAHQFEELERYYDDLFQKYKKDPQYELLLTESYDLFSRAYPLSIADLDQWVAKTGSYIAYAARGRYKTDLGFSKRGIKFADRTSDQQFSEMQRLFDEAAKDLRLAISKNPSFPPAYSGLVNMAMAGDMPFTAKDILDQALKQDNRSYSVRAAYMSSLEPKWGGSYEEMEAFAKSSLQYIEFNPALWTLQGEADATRAVAAAYREYNYPVAIEFYDAALRYGDRVRWLKQKAECYLQLGEPEKAIPIFKKVLSYDPSDSSAANFVATGNSLGLKHDLSDNTFIDPKAAGMKIRSYAVLSVEHKVSWLTARPDKGQSITEQNADKIERMIKKLGYDCLDWVTTLSFLGRTPSSPLSSAELDLRLFQQVGKATGADAVIIATLPSMGKNHPKNMYFEDIDIKAVSTLSGEIVWNSALKGTVVDTENKRAFPAFFNSIENQLYDLLRSKLAAIKR